MRNLDVVFVILKYWLHTVNWIGCTNDSNKNLKNDENALFRMQLAVTGISLSLILFQI